MISIFHEQKRSKCEEFQESLCKSNARCQCNPHNPYVLSLIVDYNCGSKKPTDVCGDDCLTVRDNTMRFIFSSSGRTENSCRWKQSLCQHTPHAHCGSPFFSEKLRKHNLNCCEVCDSDCTVCVCGGGGAAGASWASVDVQLIISQQTGTHRQTFLS